MILNHLTAFVSKYNEAYYPNYKLVIWGPYNTVSGSYTIGLEVQELNTYYSIPPKALFTIADEIKGSSKEDIAKTELEIIKAFKKITINPCM